MGHEAWWLVIAAWMFVSGTVLGMFLAHNRDRLVDWCDCGMLKYDPDHYMGTFTDMVHGEELCQPMSEFIAGGGTTKKDEGYL